MDYEKCSKEEVLDELRRKHYELREMEKRAVKAETANLRTRIILLSMTASVLTTLLFIYLSSLR